MVFGWGKKKPESKPEPQIETVPQSRDVSISDFQKLLMIYNMCEKNRQYWR
jgi:hypothetical protein